MVPVGAATLGLHRPDVGGFFQNAQFNPSGWSLTVASGTLSAGQYLLIVYAHSTVNSAWIASTRILYVDQPTVTLTIDRAGGGTGGVTSNPSGLSCAGGASTQAVPCATSYPQTSQTPVTLTATADTGSAFTGWSGARSGTGACQVTMSQAQNVVAAFQTYTTTYYHLDTLGSVRAITDSQAVPAVIATHTYQPFGEDTAPLTGDPTRFTGKELDAETALQYFGARYYRNRIGRFLSVDPIGGGLVDPQRWNPYAYARNNPLRFVDFDGRKEADKQTCTGAQVGEGENTRYVITCKGIPSEDDRAFEAWFDALWEAFSGRADDVPPEYAPRPKPEYELFNKLLGDIAAKSAPIVPVARVLVENLPTPGALPSKGVAAVKAVRRTYTVYTAMKDGVVTYVGQTVDFLRRQRPAPA